MRIMSMMAMRQEIVFILDRDGCQTFDGIHSEIAGYAPRYNQEDARVRAALRALVADGLLWREANVYGVTGAGVDSLSPQPEPVAEVVEVVEEAPASTLTKEQAQALYKKAEAHLRKARKQNGLQVKTPAGPLTLTFDEAYLQSHKLVWWRFTDEQGVIKYEGSGTEPALYLAATL